MWSALLKCCSAQTIPIYVATWQSDLRTTCGRQPRFQKRSGKRFFTEMLSGCSHASAASLLLETLWEETGRFEGSRRKAIRVDQVDKLL
jgi:hypothetical protein